MINTVNTTTDVR